MTKPAKHIFSAEQIAAHQSAARAANPRRERIDELREQINALSREIGALTSDEEKYLNILMFLSKDFDSRECAVKVMSDQEIGNHLSELFFPHAQGQLDEMILMETLERLGWRAEEDEL